MWDCLISPLIDNERSVWSSLRKEKTKCKHVPRPIRTNENPVGNDRVSTYDMFLARGLAAFLKVQVDVIQEL